jgi:hypothetical protein
MVVCEIIHSQFSLSVLFSGRFYRYHARADECARHAHVRRFAAREADAPGRGSNRAMLRCRFHIGIGDSSIPMFRAQIL